MFSGICSYMSAFYLCYYKTFVHEASFTTWLNPCNLSLCYMLHMVYDSACILLWIPDVIQTHSSQPIRGRGLLVFSSSLPYCRLFKRTSMFAGMICRTVESCAILYDVALLDNYDDWFLCKSKMFNLKDHGVRATSCLQLTKFWGYYYITVE